MHRPQEEIDQRRAVRVARECRRAVCGERPAVTGDASTFVAYLDAVLSAGAFADSQVDVACLTH